jgi:preprotein translocase subunit SecD
MKRNQGVGFVIMALVLIAATLISAFSLTIFDDKGRPAFKINGMDDIRLGIDIRGGVEALFTPEAGAKNVTPEGMDSARSVIQRRLDAANITDSSVTIDYSKQRILVWFPWKSSETSFDPNKAINELGQMGKLSFKYYNGNVILEGSEVTRAYYDTLNGKPIVQLEFSASGAKKFADATTNVINKTVPAATASPDAAASSAPSPSASGAAASLSPIPSTSPVSSAGAVASASPSASGSAAPSASASASAPAESSTSGVTADQIAIYLDNDLISHPTVETTILDGKCYIENLESDDTAKNLANLISSGSLPFKLTSNSNNSISPTLGTKALDLMTTAGLIAFIMVCLFMLIIYRLPGFVACFALLGQVVGQLLTLSISQFTLTLPGIAGIILSIGMGVDANIISAERVKEEIYSGKTIRAALDAGYNKAFSAVADGNVTVAIVAVLLWILGTGSMISFGFTLLIGVIFNFICGVGVSKIMLKSLVGLKFSQNRWLYGYSAKKDLKANGGAENA